MTEFNKQLEVIKDAMRQGDQQRLADKAGVSLPTFRSTFTKQSALTLTEAEERVLKVCMEDEELQTRIKNAKAIAEQAKRVAEGIN